MGCTSQSDAGRRARDQDNSLNFSFHIALHRITKAVSQ
jgi:hypothetical protein